MYLLLLLIPIAAASPSQPLAIYALCKDPCNSDFLQAFQSIEASEGLVLRRLNLSSRDYFDFAVSYEIGNFDIPALLATKDEGSLFIKTFGPLQETETLSMKQVVDEFVKRARSPETWFMKKGGHFFLLSRFFYLDYFLYNKMRAFVYSQGILGILAIFFGLCC